MGCSQYWRHLRTIDICTRPGLSSCAGWWINEAREELQRALELVHGTRNGACSSGASGSWTRGGRPDTRSLLGTGSVLQQVYTVIAGVQPAKLAKLNTTTCRSRLAPRLELSDPRVLRHRAISLHTCAGPRIAARIDNDPRTIPTALDLPGSVSVRMWLPRPGITTTRCCSTVEADLGGGTVHLPAARFSLVDDAGKIESEQVIFCAAEA